MTPDEAIEIVARQVLANAAEDLDWADYPEIGEHDWTDVQAAAERLAPLTNFAKFQEAYALLEARAERYA